MAKDHRKLDCRTAVCECGKVTFEAVREPIMTIACYCTSCQKAAMKLAARSGSAAITEADGGTGFIMYRKDRVHCRSGAEQLREHRLSPESTTRRVVAECCNSPMFLEFEKGHWLSMYRNRFAVGAQPEMEMRTMTEDRKAGVEFADGIPSPKKHSATFMWKLLSAWVAMGFRTPKVDYVAGALDDE